MHGTNSSDKRNISHRNHERAGDSNSNRMKEKGTADVLLKWISVAAAIGGLGIGAFFLEARHSVQSAEIKELIKSENAKYSEQIEQNVTHNIQNHLKEFRDSINADHARLMQSNYQKDSLLLIVMPRMLEQVKEATNTAKRIEAQVNQSDTTDTNKIWQYLKAREERDSILSRDAQIMRELRSINNQLLLRPKFGDRIK